MTRVDTPSRSEGCEAAPAEQARGLLGLLGGWRLKPIWVSVLILLAIFTLVRLGLLLGRYDMLAGRVGSEHILHCFLLGARFDLMPIGYAMLPMVLTLSLAPAAALARPRLRRAVAIYAAAIVTIAVGTEIFGIFFFLRFGRRLNYIAFAYFVHRETLVYMWNRYPMWGLIPVIPGVFYLSYRLLRRWFWRGTGGAWPPRRRVVAAAALLALCVVACRGGLSRRPLRRGSAYFSGNLLVDQLAMNDLFTMFHAARSELADGQGERETYPLPSLAEASAVTHELLYQAADTPGEHPANPLWRRSDSGRPRRDYNVVVILMEGMAGRPVGAMGFQPSHTPHLDALCREGLYLERMYAAGPRTSRGMVGVLCGHPDLGGITLMKRSRAIGRFLTLPAVLRDRGYHTMFIYGGRPEFDNMGEFFTAGGVREIIGEEDMGAEPGNWGVPDETIFQRAHERFEEMGDRRFFAAVLTVSNHPPFEIPAGRCELLPTDDEDERNKVLNAYRYADWALGEFFRYARRARYFENTIFVLVSDHGRQLNQSRLVDVPGFRIPCLIYAPGIVAPARLRTVAGQTDIAPTVLGLLGGQYEHCFLGRNILDVAEGDGFALLHEDVHMAFVRDELALTIPPRSRDHKPTLFRLASGGMLPVPPDATDPNQVASLQRQMLSYYEMARHLYVAGAYCDPKRYAETTTAPTTSAGAD